MLHHVDVPLDRAIERLRRRTDPASHRLAEQGLRQFETIYESPASDEGILIRRHT